MELSDLSLPPECILRKAIPNDNWSIRLLVLSAKLDPTQLLWEQFSVIECQRKLVACGQLRNFAAAQELGSIVVASAWQRRGLGSLMTQHLIRQATQPLYLECLGKRLAEFYRHHQFVEIDFTQLPLSLKGKFGLSNLGRKLLRVPVIYMKYCTN